MITQSRNALGNLINRYRAVLHKCRLCNVFGSLAVAGMLVIGGAGTASSTVYHTQITGTEQDYDAIKTIDGDMVTYTFKEGDSLEVIEQSGINVGNGNIYNITIKNNLDIHISQENTSASLKGITIGKDNAIFNMDGGSISITSKNSQSFKFAAPKGVFVWSKNAEVSLGDMNIYIEESNAQYAAEARGIDINYQNTVTLGNASLTVQAVNEQGMAEDFVRAAGMSADGTSGANEVKADSLFIQADAKGNKEVKAWGVGLTRGSIGSIGNGDITASAVSRCCVPIGCSPFPSSISWKFPHKPTNERGKG